MNNYSFYSFVCLEPTNIPTHQWNSVDVYLCCSLQATIFSASLTVNWPNDGIFVSCFLEYLRLVIDVLDALELENE